jgi:hypothetical protein
LNIELQQFKFEINNGGYLIGEYCRELERQVQQAKEEKILILETESDLLLNEIKDYKNKTTNEYLNNTQLKEK